MEPEGWIQAPLGKLIERVARPVSVDTTRTYQEIGIRSHGKGLFDKEPVTGAALGNKRVFWVEPNCLVLNIVFAWEQAVGQTTEQDVGKIASHRFPMYRPRSGRSDIDYLTYLFKTPYGKYLLALASPGGAGRNKTLGQTDFLKTVVRVPQIHEQQAISHILKTWDRAIEEAGKLFQNHTAHYHALMQQLLTAETRFPNFERQKWTRHIIGQLGTTYGGLTGKTQHDFGHGSPYIPYVNIFTNSCVDLGRMDYVRLDPGEKQHRARYGDIFFTTSSEVPEEVGMSSVLLDDVGEIYLNSFCFGLRLHNFDILAPQFARFLFRAPQVRRSIGKLAQGATRYNLPKGQFLKISLSIPPLEEQLKIASCLAAAEGAVQRHSAYTNRLRQEKQSLMQQLLTGKLRVKLRVAA